MSRTTLWSSRILKISVPTKPMSKWVFLCNFLIEIHPGKSSATASSDTSKTVRATQVGNQAEICFQPPPRTQWLTHVCKGLKHRGCGYVPTTSGEEHIMDQSCVVLGYLIKCHLLSHPRRSQCKQLLGYCHVQQAASTCSLRNMQVTHASALLHPLIHKRQLFPK